MRDWLEPRGRLFPGRRSPNSSRGAQEARKDSQSGYPDRQSEFPDDRSGHIADRMGIHHAFFLPAICYLYIALFALKGKPVAREATTSQAATA